MEHFSIIKDAARNSEYRKVLMTHRRLQVAVMSLKPDEDTDFARFPYDQLYLVIAGNATAHVNDERVQLKVGDIVSIPEHTKGEIYNSGTKDELKLIAIISPPKYKTDTDDMNRPEGLEDPFEIRE